MFGEQTFRPVKNGLNVLPLGQTGSQECVLLWIIKMLCRSVFYFGLLRCYVGVCFTLDY